MRDVAHAVVVGLMMRADLSENDGSAGRRISRSREAILSQAKVLDQLRNVELEGVADVSTMCDVTSELRVSEVRARG